MYNLSNLKQQFKQINTKQIQIDNLLNQEKYNKIQSQIITLFDQKEKEINKTTIKVFFIGAVNSGKSTLINAIIGHPLLSTGNQKSDYYLTKIQQHNLNTFTYYEMENDDLEIIEKTPQDLRKKMQGGTVSCQFLHQFDVKNIQLIDTPGLYYDNEQENQKIVELMQNEIGDNDVPIFVAVINNEYENELKMMINELKKIKLSKNISFLSSYNQFLYELENNSNNDKIERNSLIVINKFDYPQQFNWQELVEFKQQKIFRISAKNAFQYNLFRQNKNQQMIEEFYLDYKNQYGLQNIEEAQSFIKNNIINNDNIIILQDFNSFLSSLNWDIRYEFNKKSINKTHHQLQSSLCILDLINQGIQGESNFGIILQINKVLNDHHNDYLQIKEQLNQHMSKLFEERTIFSKQVIIKISSLVKKHDLNKFLDIYICETLDYIKTWKNVVKSTYETFKNKIIALIKSLIGGLSLSYEFLAFSNLNLSQQCSLIFDNIEMFLDEQDLSIQIKLLTQKIGLCECQSSFVNTIHQVLQFFKNIGNKEKKLSQVLASTKAKINNEELEDLSIIQENIYQMEKMIIQNLIDFKNNYLFGIEQIMIGINEFTINIH